MKTMKFSLLVKDNGLRVSRLSKFPTESWLNGTLTNTTGEPLLIYGPKSKLDGMNFDNSMYVLLSGYTTPTGFDCDGFYLPSNSKLYDKCGKLRASGVAAIKFNDLQSPIISGTYVTNLGPSKIFKTGSTVNWWIPVAINLDGIKSAATRLIPKAIIGKKAMKSKNR